MNLEYAIGVYSDSSLDHAIKAHVARKESPLLVCSIRGGNYVVELLGLNPGEPEAGIPPDPHLDFYVRPDVMCSALRSLPMPSVTPTGAGLPTTFPWGTQHPAGGPVQPGRTITAVQLRAAAMFDAGQSNRVVCDQGRLNFDFEMAPYGVPQYHFGVDGQWTVRPDRRITRTWAKLELAPNDYAILYDSMCHQCSQRGLYP